MNNRVSILDFENWVSENYGKIFRYLVYKKLFTPYEQQQAFSDESIYEDSYYSYGIIEEAISLGNGKWLVGIRKVYEGDEISDIIEYYRLDEIKIEYFENDNQENMEE